MKNFKAMAIYLEHIVVVVLKCDGSMCRGIDHKEWSFPLALQLSVAKEFDPRIEHEHLISRMEFLLHDPLIMPFLCSFFADSSIVIGFLPPYFQLGNLDHSINSC